MPPEEQPTTPTAKPEGLRTSASGQWQAPSVGQMQAVLPQYEVLEMLGRGGMGAVYKARQKSLKRLVAIKVLPLGMADDEFKFAERFQNEAQTMAAMNHPAIVSVYDFGETSDGLLYFVMEFVDGTDVQKMIAGSGKLSGEHALEITAHVCDALAYAHKRGVIHRDIKPANILIDQEGHIKVADFGLAKMHDPAQTSGLTRTNMAMGTPDYVAPEVLSPGIVADHRADLYAVGVMLYQMLTGEVPRGMFKLPSQKGIGIDPRFDEIICKAMEHDREERYQSAGDVRRDLDVILTTPQPKDDGTGVVPVEEIPEKVVMNETGGPVESKAGAPARYQRPPVNRSRTPDRKSSMGLWVTIAGVVAALGVAGVIVINPKPAATDMGTQPTLSKANASPPISANGSTQPPTSTPTPPQDITNWQDMTPTILEKARTRSGFLVESGVVRAAPGTEQPPILGVTTTASRHCAVRVAYSGEAQVSLWSANKAGSVYVQTRKQDTIFKLIDTNNATVPLLPAVPNPADFDSELEHVLILAVEDARLRVWIDERFVGEAEHGILEAVGVSLAVLRHTILRKVEIADLTQGPVAAKAGERKPEIAGAVTDWLKTDVWKAPWVREGAVVKAAANDATSWIGKIADGTVRVRFRALDVGPTNAP
ncbi:MAG: serine/threonine protein kinase, partial [Verrucomicrobiaceae bacterium]|nr:serine/threonine protein kinase [Verrucomicrobiaceae bacterium]